MPPRLLDPLVLGALVLACSITVSERAGGQWLTTDATAYTATRIVTGPRSPRYHVAVVATFTNRGSTPIHLARCYPDSPIPIYGVDFLGRSDDERSAYDPAWACVGHGKPITVMPGASRVDTLHLSAPIGSHGRTISGYGAATGRMRLRYVIEGCRSEAGACRPPADVEVSNVFEVRQPR
jgi:hypothetical protein